MRYLGGKTQISKELAAQVNKYRKEKIFWDPFCGSLAMSVALGGQGLVSDVSQPLISLYKAIETGWDPPAVLSREQWEKAKCLPDTDPLKGFAGFGCSFRGLYFSGYAGGYVGPVSNFGAQAARQVLLRDVEKLVKRKCTIKCIDFFDVQPNSEQFLYLDPPYQGTHGYIGTPVFDHQKFVQRVLEWARFGPVCVSEYAFSIGVCVWKKSRARKLAVSSGTRATEKLFVVET
jgi:DNA adenine methylase